MRRALPGRFQRARSLCPELPGDGDGLARQLAAAAAAGQVVKDEAGTLLLRAPLPAGGQAWWKLYRVAPARRVLAGRVRSRAAREAAALVALGARGVPAVEVLAWAEARDPRGLIASLLVTREEGGARDLRELLRDEAEGPRRRAWLAAAGRLARQLHEAGCCHFRLQARNILLLPEVPGGAPRLLDAPYTCVFPGPAPARFRAVDLVDLAGASSPLGVEDARTLLRAYADTGPGSPPLPLAALRRRSAAVQKALRIALYLLAVNTGHRPSDPWGYPACQHRP